jgi:hypothetical protein
MKVAMAFRLAICYLTVSIIHSRIDHHSQSGQAPVPTQSSMGKTVLNRSR